MEEEIENYIQDFYPSYELFPNDFPKPTIENRINVFMDSLMDLKKTSQTHLQILDVNSDGNDDYYLEMFSLSYNIPQHPDHFSYYTSSVLILGSENGLSNTSFKFDNIELSSSDDFQHLLDRKPYLLKRGMYYFSNNLMDSLRLEIDSIVIYEDETVGILKWEGDIYSSIILMNN
ncbi:MAG: hypothetical protein BalsKO_24740 [Balneolaceae bacterium]